MQRRRIPTAAALGALLLALASCTTGVKVGPGGITSVAAPPAARVGDRWAYQVTNGYNGELMGFEEHRVVEATADHTVVETAGFRNGQRTLTPDLHWLIHPLADERYELFTPAYPALVFPLSAGQSWNVRVDGQEVATGERTRIIVQGWVSGWERVATPAGTFDALHLRRATWGGNFDREYGQSEIVEELWYAPAVGRIVRQTSQWQREILFTRPRWGPIYLRGEWIVRELLPADAVLPPMVAPPVR